MPLAPKPANFSKLQTKLSAWTPLNHPESNCKVFEERRHLLAKWFDRWSDLQRKAVLQDFALSCSLEQLHFLSHAVSRRLPLQAADFTCLLPRVLSLYIFSFLDPRSLSRCAQVSWHWKNIVELDQLWMPKCLKLGWHLCFSPTPFEQGVWKSHYVQTVQELRLRRPQQPCVVPDVIGSSHTEASPVSEERSAATTHKVTNSSRKQVKAPPPWRGADRCPKDTLRFNYLDNLDPIEQAFTAQIKNKASIHRSSTAKPGDSAKKTLSETNYKLRKAKSLMFLSSSDRDPHQSQTPAPWAPPGHKHFVTKETTQNLLHLPQWNAGIRPGPPKTAVPTLSVEVLRALRRSHRSPPSTQLFDFQPYSVCCTLSPPRGSRQNCSSKTEVGTLTDVFGPCRHYY
ncbi:F-box only protein 16 isoform X2 [Thalassophryne amazonica]|uniref:F-box only protein 16 isoform X2 n=1 Tax=Thalassophryne amazonica TaxID=390379 RepID=UPI001471E6EE|nr:F-box only protein 16 isoform X2 [Thalassophryne amazonica]